MPELAEIAPPPSSIASRVSVRRRLVVGLAVAVALAALVGGYKLFWRHHLKRFEEVSPGRLYRSAQPTQWGLAYVADRYGIRTVLNTRRFHWPLERGLLFDSQGLGGKLEGDFVAGLGIEYRQWPLGDEPYWPWPTPWFYEELFELFDNPDNLPVWIHCMGGRHRTGTAVALYRLEYDRWPVEQVLEEMHRFSFGPAIALQEHNLRTYLPRPRPDAAQWEALRSTFGSLTDGAGQASELDYQLLVHRLRQHRGEDEVEQALRRYLDENQPFALELLARLVDTPDDPLAASLCASAADCLRQSDASRDQWATAAAVIADFGTPEQQEELLALLANEDLSQPPTARYQAVVAGVSNRYTPNRLAFLRPLLDDERPRAEPEAGRYRYCDTAVARLSVITGQNLVEYWGPDGGVLWDRGRQSALAWLAEHPEQARLRPLEPPGGYNAVRPASEAEWTPPPGEE